MEEGMHVCDSVCVVERKPEEPVSRGLGNKRARETHLSLHTILC